MAIASLPLSALGCLATALAVLNPGGLLSAPRIPELLLMTGALLALLGILFGTLGIRRSRVAGIVGVAMGALCMAFCLTVCVLGFVAPGALSGWTRLDVNILVNPQTAPMG